VSSCDVDVGSAKERGESERTLGGSACAARTKLECGTPPKAESACAGETPKSVQHSVWPPTPTTLNPPLILATAPLFHLLPTTLKHPLREQRDMSTKTEKRR